MVSERASERRAGRRPPARTVRALRARGARGVGQPAGLSGVTSHHHPHEPGRWRAVRLTTPGHRDRCRRDLATRRPPPPRSRRAHAGGRAARDTRVHVLTGEGGEGENDELHGWRNAECLEGGVGGGEDRASLGSRILSQVSTVTSLQRLWRGCRAGGSPRSATFANALGPAQRRVPERRVGGGRVWGWSNGDRESTRRTDPDKFELAHD